LINTLCLEENDPRHYRL